MGAESLLSVPLSLLLGPELVNLVETFGLNQIGKGGANEATDELLGLGVLDGLAVLGLVLVELLDGLVANSSTDEVVGEVSLVALGLLDLIVGALVELGEIKETHFE